MSSFTSEAKKSTKAKAKTKVKVDVQIKVKDEDLWDDDPYSLSDLVSLGTRVPLALSAHLDADVSSIVVAYAFSSIPCIRHAVLESTCQSKCILACYAAYAKHATRSNRGFSSCDEDLSMLVIRGKFYLLTRGTSERMAPRSIPRQNVVTIETDWCTTATTDSLSSGGRFRLSRDGGAHDEVIDLESRGYLAVPFASLAKVDEEEGDGYAIWSRSLEEQLKRLWMSLEGDKATRAIRRGRSISQLPPHYLCLAEFHNVKYAVRYLSSCPRGTLRLLLALVHVTLHPLPYWEEDVEDPYNALSELHERYKNRSSPGGKGIASLCSQLMKGKSKRGEDGFQWERFVIEEITGCKIHVVSCG